MMSLIWVIHIDLTNVQPHVLVCISHLTQEMYNQAVWQSWWRTFSNRQFPFLSSSLSIAPACSVFVFGSWDMVKPTHWNQMTTTHTDAIVLWICETCETSDLHSWKCSMCVIVSLSTNIQCLFHKSLVKCVIYNKILVLYLILCFGHPNIPNVADVLYSGVCLISHSILELGCVLPLLCCLVLSVESCCTFSLLGQGLHSVI